MDSKANPQAQCHCQAYGDLLLNIESIEKRMLEFKDMRRHLKQIAQKVVEPGWEHYRLYKCEICGQLWQGCLSTIIDDGWYLFRIPSTTQKAWKEDPFVCPDTIVGYISDRNEYLSQEFQYKKEKCKTNGCSKLAIVGSVHCEFHLFESLSKAGGVRKQPKGRWFGPYSEQAIYP
ncbi:MAG: hypothetical protein KZQ93_06185 [Candidatus Thiodiazotropha sp. (ex Monitilora ramsayi)]|nr:hypothetical protein [Candidatus Thiodiazotropha sp. (ex Monitilora ramsayi)]